MDQVAPAADEIEVSIFGPGRGEAIAVHLGDGRWLTVDSCLDQATQSHPVMDYLRDIGVDIGNQVELVVATHAHDDHISGIARLYDAAREATFVTSNAMTSEEFLAHVETDKSIEAQLRQTVRGEYRAVLQTILSRSKERGGLLPLVQAQEQDALIDERGNGTQRNLIVRALSPSAMANFRARTMLAMGLAKAGDARRLSMVDPNEFAVALDVTVDNVTVLLGADLERGPTGCGWGAVLQTHSPLNPASLYKVPHHGSRHADHPEVWSELLEPSPIAVLAPFRRGSVLVPSDREVEALKARASVLYATASPKRLTPSKAVQRTAAALSGVASNVRDPYGKAGHVRARRALGGDEAWRIELLEPARRL